MTDAENVRHGASPAAESGPWARVFNRIFGQDLLYSMLLIGMAVAIASTMLVPKELTQDSDLWWHLADARILTTTHHFIRAEPYSFAVAGQRWIDPEWLAEIPYWAGYSWLGLQGIHLFALALLCANLVFVYFRSVWMSRNSKAAFWMAILAFFLMTVNSGARTIVVGYLALSAEMAIIEAAERGKTRWVWLLPPLFCLWINLHGSWLVGLGFLGLYIVCGLFNLQIGVLEQRSFTTAERNRLILVFAASLAALMVNPYGWLLIWNPIDLLAKQKLMMALMVEWQPLSLGSSTGIAAAVAIVLMIVANLVRGRKWKIYELAFILCAWYLAFAHQRFAFLACVVTMPWLATDVARSFFAEPSEKTIPALNAVFAAAVVGALIYLFPSEAELHQALSAGIPLQTIEAIQPTWRTFNDYSLGGMLAFESKPDFLDSRNDIFEHHGVLQQFVQIEALRSPFKQLDGDRIDHVLIHSNSPLAFALSLSPAWKVTMREGSSDNAYELFARQPGVPANESPSAP